MSGYQFRGLQWFLGERVENNYIHQSGILHVYLYICLKEFLKFTLLALSHHSPPGHSPVYEVLPTGTAILLDQVQAVMSPFWLSSPRLQGQGQPVPPDFLEPGVTLPPILLMLPPERLLI